MKKFVLLLVATLALAACKTVKIENGEVPDEYLSRAKKVEGVYQGSFEGRRGKLAITFQGNRPVLTYKDARGDSFVMPQCQSSVNDLKWAYVTRKGVVESVGFYFDPGVCFMDGREVVLSFSNNYNTIHVRILDRRYFDRHCRWEVVDPRVGPREICETTQREVNLNGKFSR